MGGVQRRKGNMAKNKAMHRKTKTKHYLRDHDQIHGDLKAPQNFEKLEVDETKPGAGQYYCISCARYFENEVAKDVHIKTKKHKRRLKEMEKDPYTHEEA